MITEKIVNVRGVSQGCQPAPRTPLPYPWPQPRVVPSVLPGQGWGVCRQHSSDQLPEKKTTWYKLSSADKQPPCAHPNFAAAVASKQQDLWQEEVSLNPHLSSCPGLPSSPSSPIINTVNAPPHIQVCVSPMLRRAQHPWLMEAEYIKKNTCASIPSNPWPGGRLYPGAILCFESEQPTSPIYGKPKSWAPDSFTCSSYRSMS